MSINLYEREGVMKRYIREWSDWCVIAEIYDFNPHEECEISFDEGGGDTTDFEYIGQYPLVEML